MSEIQLLEFGKKTSMEFAEARLHSVSVESQLENSCQPLGWATDGGTFTIDLELNLIEDFIVTFHLRWDKFGDTFLLNFIMKSDIPYAYFAKLWVFIELGE